MSSNGCWIPSQPVGLVGYGVSIPKYRLPVEETVRVWQNSNEEILKEKLLVGERAVLAPDEDAISLGVLAAQRSFESSGIAPEQVGALYFGTCTNPYESRPSATLIAEALGLSPFLFCADVQFGSKSGTSALQAALAMVVSGMVDYALAIGSDVMNRHTSPGTLQEYSASAAAAAVLVGRENVAVQVNGATTFVTDLSDSFRVEGERYIRSGGWAALETDIGLQTHIQHAVQRLFACMQTTVEDYTYAAFQQPVGAVPLGMSDLLGFRLDQCTPGLIAYELGDCGSASALVSLISILDVVQPYERIMLASYGFGAGSDAFDLQARPYLSEIQGRTPSVTALLDDKTLIDYATAMKYEYKYLKASPALSSWM